MAMGVNTTISAQAAARRGTVPELTQILDIKLNAQVSLWLTHAGITLPDVDGRRARAMSR